MATYPKSLSGDFSGNLDPSQLITNINADVGITPECINVSNIGDVVNIIFDSSLSVGEQTTLDTIVSSYVYIAPDVITSSNTHGAVVDKRGFGDYTSIAEAFSAGETAVFIRNNTYYETADIVLPERGQIIGESFGQVIIILLSGAKIKADGSNGVFESAGTIDVTKNSKTVTGSGTTFTNLAAGQFILIGTNYFEIGSITNDSSLELVDTYLGNSLTSQSYKAQSMLTGVGIQNMIIYGSSTVGLYLRALRHSLVSNVTSAKCLSNFEMHECSDIGLNTIICSLSLTNAITLTNCMSISMNTVNILSNTGHGMVVNGDSENILVSTCGTEENGGDGFNVIDTVKNIKIADTVMRENAGSGIIAASTTYHIIVEGSDSINNGVDGINLEGNNNTVSGSAITNNAGKGVVVGCCSTVQNNQITNNTLNGVSIDSPNNDCIISGNIIFGNSQHGICINAANTIMFGNVIRNNNKGIILLSESDDSIIADNRIFSNSSNGIEISSGATDITVSGNNAKGNTGTNLLDNGTDTNAVNNKY